MPALIDAFDWATTPLGPKRDWSPALSITYDMMMGMGFAASVMWGPERTLLYNGAYIPLLGQKHPNALGRPLDQVWHEVWDDLRPLTERALAGETVFLEDLPLTMVRNGYSEDTCWVLSYSPVRDGDAIVGILNIAIETTERVRGEQHRQMLVDECGHRVKNTLALVQAVARSTLSGVDRDVLERFDERLNAIARTQQTLDEKAWNGGDLGEIVREAVGNLVRRPVSISGPSVHLSPRVAQTVALIIHELTTNAFKHGALAKPGGRVSVDWRLDEGQLVLTWIEGGGAPAHPPLKTGFGVKLLARGLLGCGGADLRYGVEGFSATFTAPASRLTDS
ncbi:sensor histidine kinase [uncultured Brevundimonas sp.]|uniref:sensor histidine kinase n=1 Tax=uncultured Brevundimonas sp. TaxID=213418 RepID=UPI001377B543|nr:PAS domain-containing sensor histidine kinase [uncultured Brevundimonas sp.]